MKKKLTGRASSIPMGLVWSLLVSMGVTLLCCVALTSMIAGEHMPETAIGYGAMGTLLLASVSGALMAIWRVKHRYLLMCVCSGACYYLCLLCCTALFFGGQYQGMGTTALVVLGGSVLAALATVRKSGGRKRARVKYKIR